MSGIRRPNLVFGITCLESGVQIQFWNQMSRIKCPNRFLESNVWNQVSKFSFGIKCLESDVQICFWNQMSGIRCLGITCLESGVRNWFWNQVSWNQASGIDFGITCLGIRCPDWFWESHVLESHVLESGVRICYWNQVSGNHTSGIRHLGIRCPEKMLVGIKCPDTNVKISNVIASYRSHVSGIKCPGYKCLGIKWNSPTKFHTIATCTETRNFFHNFCIIGKTMPLSNWHECNLKLKSKIRSYDLVSTIVTYHAFVPKLDTTTQERTQ